LVSKLIKNSEDHLKTEYNFIQQTNFDYSGQIDLFIFYLKNKYPYVENPAASQNVILEFAGYVINKHVSYLTDQADFFISCSDLIKLFKRLKSVFLKPKYSLPNQPTLREYGVEDEILGDTILVSPPEGLKGQIVKKAKMAKEGFEKIPKMIKEIPKLIPKISLLDPIITYPEPIQFKKAKSNLDSLVNKDKFFRKITMTFINSKIEMKDLAVEKISNGEDSVPEISTSQFYPLPADCKVIESIQ
jgi:hypothetical protein